MAFLDQYVALYIGNDTIYGHIYNGRQMRSRSAPFGKKFLVHELHGNFPTPNNPHRVDYFYTVDIGRCAFGSHAHQNHH